MLGTLNGGVETDAVATIRPAEAPDHGTLTSGVIGTSNVGTTDPGSIPSATQSALQIQPRRLRSGHSHLREYWCCRTFRLSKTYDIANRIQTAVRALKPSNPAYRDFTCVATTITLVLSSGTRGVGSSVLVSAGAVTDIAGSLQLLSGTTSTQPINLMLTNGNESPYTAADAHNLFIADRSQRQGIYARR